jgi:hypothetical protein
MPVKITVIIKLIILQHSSSFFFSFGVLQLMLSEAPQPYGLFYNTRIGFPTFFTSSALPPPREQRKLEL